MLEKLLINFTALLDDDTKTFSKIELLQLAVSADLLHSVFCTSANYSNASQIPNAVNLDEAILEISSMLFNETHENKITEIASHISKLLKLYIN